MSRIKSHHDLKNPEVTGRALKYPLPSDFRYMTVRDLIPKKSVTNRSKLKWNLYIYQGLMVSILKALTVKYG